MSKHALRLAVAGVAAFGLVAGFATTAHATPGQTSPCSGCHSLDSQVVVNATQISNDGTNATYNVTVSNPYGMNGWGVFSGSTKLTGAAASSGTFIVADGASYKVFGVSGNGNGNQGYGSVTISPVKPAPVPTPVPTVTPDPTPVPTVTPDPTPVPTVTPDPTPVPTVTPDPTPVPTVTPDPTPVPTVTPDPTPVPSPSDDPSSDASPTVRGHHESEHHRSENSHWRKWMSNDFRLSGRADD